MAENQFVISYDRSLFSFWQRSQELPSYRTFYDQTDFSAGYRRAWSPGTAWTSHFTLGLHHSRVTGSAENLGSHRELFGVETGYTQSLWRHLFLSGTFIPGYAFNHANFGKGTPLSDEGSLNLKIKGMLGAQYCINPHFCPGGYLGGSAEISALGSQSYSILSAGIGLSISGSLEKAPTHSPSVQTKTEGNDTPEEPKAPRLDFSGASSPDVLSPSLKEQIRTFAEKLWPFPNKIFIIEGNSTVSSDPRENRIEAYRMALAVHSYLINELGLSAKQFTLGVNEHSTQRKNEIVDAHGPSIGRDRPIEGQESGRWVVFREVQP